MKKIGRDVQGPGQEPSQVWPGDAGEPVVASGHRPPAIGDAPEHLRQRQGDHHAIDARGPQGQETVERGNTSSRTPPLAHSPSNFAPAAATGAPSCRPLTRSMPHALRRGARVAQQEVQAHGKDAQNQGLR